MTHLYCNVYIHCIKSLKTIILRKKIISPLLFSFEKWDRHRLHPHGCRLCLSNSQKRIYPITYNTCSHCDHFQPVSSFQLNNVVISQRGVEFYKMASAEVANHLLFFMPVTYMYYTQPFGAPRPIPVSYIKQMRYGSAEVCRMILSLFSRQFLLVQHTSTYN